MEKIPFLYKCSQKCVTPYNQWSNSLKISNFCDYIFWKVIGIYLWFLYTKARIIFMTLYNLSNKDSKKEKWALRKFCLKINNYFKNID